MNNLSYMLKKEIPIRLLTSLSDSQNADRPRVSFSILYHILCWTLDYFIKQ